MGHFAISIPSRWRCSQLWYLLSDRGFDEAYQVSFRLIKVWPRLQPPNQFWVDVVVHNIITFEQKSIQKISLASSVQLSPKIIWDNFGKNWTDFQGGVAKRLLSIYFNTADRRCFGKWQMRHFQNQHNPGNKMTSNVYIWDNISKVKHFFKDRNISRTVGGAVFILLWYRPGHDVDDPYRFLWLICQMVQKIWKCMTHFKMADRGFNQSWHNWHLLIRHDTRNP